jgi:hypothetical protein
MVHIIKDRKERNKGMDMVSFIMKMVGYMMDIGRITR